MIGCYFEVDGQEFLQGFFGYGHCSAVSYAPGVSGVNDGTSEEKLEAKAYGVELIWSDWKRIRLRD